MPDIHEIAAKLGLGPDDLEGYGSEIAKVKPEVCAAPRRRTSPPRALLGEVFAANPMHPAHHYRIHLWDREKPERALESAALCGRRRLVSLTCGTCRATSIRG